MGQPTPHDLANALLASPAWARVGLTAPREQLRLAAAKELALQIQEVLDGHAESDPRQIALPL